MNLTATQLQWTLVVGISVLMYFISPWAKNTKDFFKGESKAGKETSTLILTSSLVISWIFAKSISNTANLGAKFGIVGGVAYASYYLAFLVAGIVIYNMRIKAGVKSLHEFIRTKFGKSAVQLFSLLIIFRLFNEVWSNTMVIGSYFGNHGTFPYFFAILIFTITTLAYVIKGGMKSSLKTDLIQMFLFVIVLAVILGILLPKNHSANQYLNSGSWTIDNGINLLFVGLIQVFSYPFHDPVLTDRGFISSPKITLRSFALASFFGVIFIILFSLIGVYAKLNKIEGGESAFEVSKTLGVGIMLLMNLIMISSATSTLDSTFSSFSKLLVVDLRVFKKISISNGRLTMVLITLVGTIPVFFSPEILDATTISGTMVIGLAPIFILWKLKVPRYAFHLVVLIGIFFGISLTLKILPSFLFINKGVYSDLLTINLVGTITCFSVYLLSSLFYKNESKN
jgi:Na+/proline symporter